MSISAVTINVYFTPLSEGGKQSDIRFETSLWSRTYSRVTGNVYLHTPDAIYTFVQLEGIALVPFSPATSKLDLPIFIQFQHKDISPDGELTAAGERFSDSDVQLYKDIKRILYWFSRHIAESIPEEERHGLLPHF